MRREPPADTSDYIEFGDVARARCGQQCQYASRNLAGELGSTDLGSDLRWYGNTADYHFLMIHREDADEFVRRMREHRITSGCGWTGEVTCPACVGGQVKPDPTSALHSGAKCPHCNGTGKVSAAVARRLENS